MNLNLPEIEKKIIKFWQEHKIFQQLREKNKGNKPWSFLDGPITANNPMGVHHAWGRSYKDLFQRYHAMEGYDERFQNGFDCQGLWVEVEVEKELGFKDKKDIEAYGIERFINKCKERVKKYSQIQTEQSIRLGQWMDWDHSYYTMSDENNYTIWHFLKQCWQKGLLYKGRDVVPWCPRCGTAISQHEILTEEYKTITHKAVYVRLPVKGEKNLFFLAWTTTPWTLPANVALAVQPDFDYAKVKDAQGDVYILLKDKADIIPNGTIIETLKGKDMAGMTYEGIFDELPAVKDSLADYQHSLILWADVTAEEGTGVVHTAPGCGQEDFHLSQSLGIPVIDPTNEESRYKEGFGFLTGQLVTASRELIFEDLKKKNLVYRIEDYQHRYPTCWRCKSELIFRLVDEWYISMDKLREELIASVKKVNWVPSFGLERELDWLRHMDDWLISKKRYWGLALPIYECSHCGHFEVIGSQEELKERAVEGWPAFEGHSPHRPFVDEVKIQCSQCGAVVSRIKDVGNPWLDAGIVPFSTLSYFKDKDYWQHWFPVDLISESFPGQFKNWFYALLVMSQVLEGKPPMKKIFGYATVVDEQGEEMHKSKGNAIWFGDAVEEMGADVMRWMYLRQNPVYDLRFGYNVAKEVKRKLLTLWNSYLFFETYVLNNKKRDFQYWGESAMEQQAIKSLLNKWILSRLNQLMKTVKESLDNLAPDRASGAIEDFFINDFSLWFIRRSRKIFQSAGKDGAGEEERAEAANVFYHVLLNLLKLTAPFIPFFSEEVYSHLRREPMPASIHLWDWPIAKEERILPALEKEMERIREVIALALAKRAEAGIKTRQPLSCLTIKDEGLNFNPALLTLLKEEVNVKEIAFDKEIAATVILDETITPELKKEGIVREFIRTVNMLRKELGLTPQDKIEIYYQAGELSGQALTDSEKTILTSTAARAITAVDNIEENKDYQLEKELDVFQETVKLAIKKIK